MPSGTDSKLTSSSTSAPSGTPITSVPRTAGAGKTSVAVLCAPGRRDEVSQGEHVRRGGRAVLVRHARLQLFPVRVDLGPRMNGGTSAQVYAMGWAWLNPARAVLSRRPCAARMRDDVSAVPRHVPHEGRRDMRERAVASNEDRLDAGERAVHERHGALVVVVGAAAQPLDDRRGASLRAEVDQQAVRRLDARCRGAPRRPTRGRLACRRRAAAPWLSCARRRRSRSSNRPARARRDVDVPKGHGVETAWKDGDRHEPVPGGRSGARYHRSPWTRWARWSRATPASARGVANSTTTLASAGSSSPSASSTAARSPRAMS